MSLKKLLKTKDSPEGRENCGGCIFFSLGKKFKKHCIVLKIGWKSATIFLEGAAGSGRDKH